MEGQGRAALVCHDALDYTRTIPDGAVSLVISSPPYNLGKVYERGKLSMEAFMEQQQELIAELARVTAEDGSVCWQVGNHVDRGEVFPLDIFFYPLFHAQGMHLRNRIIWHFGHGLHAKKRFSGRYETILWFTKTDDYTFNLDPVRVPSKYPGKRHYKGPKKGQLSGNPLGKNPSDIWEALQEDWETLMWDIPNVKANHPEKTEHPCQYPIELAERCVLATTNPGELVYDPYAGVATSLVAAVKHGRNALGVDKEQRFVELGRRRLELLERGELPMRAIGTPIHVARQSEKAARYPEEWLQPPEGWNGAGDVQDKEANNL